MRSPRQILCCSGLRPKIWQRRYSTVDRRGVLRVASARQIDLDIDAFRERAFRPEQPLLVKSGDGELRPEGTNSGDASLPAARLWFVSESSGTANKRLAPRLEEFSMLHLPYELIYPPQRAADSEGGNESSSASEGSIASFTTWLADDTDPVRSGLAELLDHNIFSVLRGQAEKEQKLIRMHAPLALFLAALEYNRKSSGRDGTASHSPLTQLYIAQASLSDLPVPLQRDLPAPDFVRHGGRGDIYDASIWLGLEPTYTPWHRDPNPNLFCQLCSRKTIRLMPPAGGERIFRQVRAELLKSRSAAGAVHARIRGEEMMQGPERLALHDAVWARDPRESGEPSGMQEAHLGPGDMLFIPKGWWHSVRSVLSDGRLNASVNWWFR